MLVAVIVSRRPSRSFRPNWADDMNDNDRRTVKLFGCLMAGRRSVVEDEFSSFSTNCVTKNCCMSPLARGGDPIEIFRVRLRRRSLSQLLCWLPRQECSIKRCSSSTRPDTWSITIRSGRER